MSGYRVHSFTYRLPSGEEKKLSSALWLPEQPGPRPLVLFSHGYLGCSVQSSYLLGHLAARGYVAAAPEHDDAKMCGIGGERKPFRKLDFRKSMMENAGGRVSDVRALLEEMLRMSGDASSAFHGRIDGEAVGVAGHSLGGWTAMALAGAVAGAREPRIKAALLLAPFLKDFGAEDYGRVAIPSMHLIGENDQHTLSPMLGFILREERTPRRKAYDCCGPPKYLAVVKDANHFTFTNFTCFFYKSLEACRQSNPKANAIMRLAAAFFDRYLKGDQTSAALEENDPQVTWRESVV